MRLDTPDVVRRGLQRYPLLAPGGVAASVAVLFVYVGAVDPNQHGHYPTCPYLLLTGLYCPGCGTLRMIHALAHGHFGEAFGRNMLAFFLLPLLAFIWARWTVRLGDGTEYSRRRMVDALEQLWPYTAEMFETDELTAQLLHDGVAGDPAMLRKLWEAFVRDVLERATLPVPELGTRRPTGGRRGRHGEVLGHLLAEMQWLHRSYPGVRW